MIEPSERDKEVIFLLFPDLADRLTIDWERMEFRAEAQGQLRRVRSALDYAEINGYARGFERAVEVHRGVSK